MLPEVCLYSSRNRGSVPLVSVVRNYGSGIPPPPPLRLVIFFPCGPNKFVSLTHSEAPQVPADCPPFTFMILLLSPLATQTHIRKSASLSCDAYLRWCNACVPCKLSYTSLPVVSPCTPPPPTLLQYCTPVYALQMHGKTAESSSTLLLSA